MAGQSVAIPNTQNYLELAGSNLEVPWISPALTDPYAKIERVGTFTGLMTKLGREVATRKTKNMRVDSKDRLFTAFQVLSNVGSGVNATTVITFTAASLGPATGLPAYPNGQRHPFFVNDIVALAQGNNTGNNDTFQAVVTAVNATTITVQGYLGTDVGAYIIPNQTLVYHHASSHPEISTNQSIQWWVGTTSESFDTQKIRHGCEESNDSMAAGLRTWYSKDGNPVDPTSGQAIYWAQELMDDTWKMYVRKKNNMLLLQDPAVIQNATDTHCTGLLWAAANRGTVDTVPGGWANLAWSTFEDYFQLQEDNNFGVMSWVGITSSRVVREVNYRMTDLNLGNELYTLGDLNREHTVKIGFNGYENNGYKIGWMAVEEFTNTQSQFYEISSNMYLMPDGVVNTVGGTQPYCTTVYTASERLSLKDTMAHLKGFGEGGEVVTISDVSQWGFIGRWGNIIRLYPGLGVLFG